MLRISVILIILCAIAGSSLAADRYWIGLSGAVNNWNNTANWSTTSGGTGGASVPGSADIAIFDANGLGNCTINATVNIAGINVQSGYTGTIDQGANTITVGSSNATFSGGTFTGGSENMTVNGTLTISGTAFTSTSARLLIRHLSFTSGTFTHNNGKVTFGSNSTSASSISGSISLYDGEFNGTTYNMTYTIASGTVITVNNELTYTSITGITINTGTIEAKGNITLNNTSTVGGGSGTLKINGTGAQTLDGTSAINHSRLPNVIIDKASGTLTIDDTLTVAGNWTYTQGTVNAGTSYIYFSGTKTISGSHTLNNVIFRGVTTSTYTIASGTTLTISGEMRTDGTNGITFNTGVIEAHGNISLFNTSVNGGGTATVKISGTANQTLTGPGASPNSQSRLPHVEINKSSGTLYLADFISVEGNWKYVQGTVDASTYSSTIYFIASKNIEGAHSLYNIWFAGVGGGSTFTIVSGTTITVTGTLTYNGSTPITLSTGTIDVTGNISVANTASGGGGSALIKINGTGSQTITGATSGNNSHLPSVEIDKTSGTLFLQNNIRVSGNWTYTQGTIDPGTSLVIFANSKTITGSHSLYNVLFSGGSTATFTIASGTTLTALGEFKTDGAGAVTINTGTIEAKGTCYCYCSS